MNKYYVYSLVDPTTKLPFYIGKGTGNRALEHLKKPKKTEKNIRKIRYINDIRSKGLEPLVVILFFYSKEIDAYEKEEKLIDSYGRCGIDENGILTNICSINRPPSQKGIPRSMETKLKMSSSHSTPEAIQSHIERNTGKLNPNYGKKQYELYVNKYGQEEADRRWQERNTKIANTIKGSKHSPERRQKSSLFTKGKLNVGSRFIYNVNTGLTKRIHKDKLEQFLFNNKEWKIGRKSRLQ